MFCKTTCTILLTLFNVIEPLRVSKLKEKYFAIPTVTIALAITIKERPAQDSECMVLTKVMY